MTRATAEAGADLALTFEELVVEVADGDPASTAAKVLRRLKVGGLAAKMLAPVVAFYVLNMQRSSTRRVEYEAARSGGMTSAHARSLVMAESFAIGGGKFVTWGAATVEQHRARISLLVAHRDGVTLTIARHTEAIDVIVAHGVECLDQVEVAAQ